jgi:phospholipid/cholesterol/gamma-HCH transport system substrate-binding protein
MQNTSDRRRLSPFMIQSAVGLMILVSLGLLGWLLLWLTNFSFGSRSYKATILFPNAGGMVSGTRVSYRGVRVGQVLSVQPEPGGVAIEVEISPPDLLIPSNSFIEAIQSGLVGETSIDISPLQPLPPGGVKAKPLEPDCDHAVIICNGSRLKGAGRLDVNALIRSMLKISNVLGNPEFIATVKTIAKKTSYALGDISELSRESSDFLRDVKKNNSLGNLSSTLQSVNKAAGNVSSLSNEASTLLRGVQPRDTFDKLDSTLTSVGEVADQIRIFMAVNQNNIADTLTSIRQTSDRLRVTVVRLDPLLQQAEKGQLLANLEKMSANAVQLTESLRDLSANLNDPKTILMLQQILDSARSSFENIQKITSDVDELTGNPRFRSDLLKLIQGLSSLVSSTQDLQQQVQYAQMLGNVAAEVPNNPSQEKKPISASPKPMHPPASPTPAQSKALSSSPPRHP